MGNYSIIIYLYVLIKEKFNFNLISSEFVNWLGIIYLLLAKYPEIQMLSIQSTLTPVGTQECCPSIISIRSLIHILASDLKKNNNNYVFKARSQCCIAFKYVFIFFFNLSVRNLENFHLKRVLWYTISICICMGRQRILTGYCVVE